MSATIEINANPVLVGMGQIAVGHGPTPLSAVLGSCIGLAIYHPRLHVGALAHVVLPGPATPNSAPGKFADTAVTHLIALLDKEGAHAAGLVAKIAGAASMFATAGPLQIGEANVAAVERALDAAHIRVVGRNVGGNKGRRVTFSAAAGDYLIEIVGQPPLNI